jgi:hypothetical protein
MGHATIKPEKSKSDTHGHPTSTKTWTAKSVCSHIHSKCISDEQTKLSNDGDKIIGNYRAALGKVFEDLDEVELEECENLAVEWNTKPLPDEIQQKYGNFLLSSKTSLMPA